MPWGYTGRQKGDGHMLAKKGIVSSGTGCEKRPTCGEVSKHQLPSDQGLGCFDFYLCYFHSHSYFTIQEQPLAGQLCSPGITQGFWASYRAEVQLRLCLLSPTPWELLTQTFFFLILIVELEFSSLNKGELKASLGLLETQSHPLSNHRGKVGGIKESLTGSCLRYLLTTPMITHMASELFKPEADEALGKWVEYTPERVQALLLQPTVRCLKMKLQAIQGCSGWN